MAPLGITFNCKRFTVGVAPSDWQPPSSAVVSWADRRSWPRTGPSVALDAFASGQGGNTAPVWAALSAHQRNQWQEMKYQLLRSRTAW